MSSRQACARRSLSTPRRARNSSLPAISNAAVLGDAGDDDLGQVVGQLGVLVGRRRAPAPRSSRRRARGAARPATQRAASAARRRDGASLMASLAIMSGSAQVSVARRSSTAHWLRGAGRLPSPRAGTQIGAPSGAPQHAAAPSSGSSCAVVVRSRRAPVQNFGCDAVGGARARQIADALSSAVQGRPKSPGSRPGFGVPSRATVKRQAGVADAAARRARRRSAVAEAAGTCPGRSATSACSENTQVGSLVARAVGVVVAARAPVGVGRGAAACWCRPAADELPLVAVELVAVVVAAARRRCTASTAALRPGSSSLTHLPTMQSMSDSQTNPSRPGMQSAGLAGPESLRSRSGWAGSGLRVAVGDADVGRVGRRPGPACGRQDCAGRAGRAAASRSPPAGSRGGRRADGRRVSLRVELVEERRRAGRADGVAAVVVLRAGLHRDADALVAW